MSTPTFEGRGHARRLYSLNAPQPETHAPWRAWDCAEMIRKEDQPHASLGGYLLNAPGAHPFWSWFLLEVIHLRPIEGMKAPALHRPESSHEFLIISFNPECGEPSTTALTEWMDAQRAAGKKWMLTPPDLCHQVSGATDEQARRIMMLLARAMCDGYENPDSDFRSRNEHVIDSTLAHYIAGKHPIQ